MVAVAVAVVVAVGFAVAVVVGVVVAVGFGVVVGVGVAVAVVVAVAVAVGVVGVVGGSIMKMQATCDEAKGIGNYPVWLVTVTGENNMVRAYEITGGSERSAVSEAMRRFEAEFAV